MFIVTVLFEIHAEHHEAFMQAMRINAKTSLAVESGCRQFDVCEAEAPERTVFLYEVYDSQSDFTHHLQSPHFVQFNQLTEPWVSSKQVRSFKRDDAA